ncbi:MAG: dihydrolipoyl dehydrogenase [Deltaproteobacteria bacterium]|nr:dihydrolipoyl dehydrogenase [Deltaproteobacteria bacterium]
MKQIKLDVAVIGAGTAGLGAYRAALKHTDKIAIIEGGPFGTTCARVGCMPSKLLIAAADAAHGIKKAPGFGIHPQGETRIDGEKVMGRVRSERDRFVGFVLESIDGIDKAHIIRGYARFVGPLKLQVDEHTLIEAKSVVIATGSEPMVPPPFKDLGKKLLLNDDIFEMRDLPKSMAVIGPGIIGLEIGQALHRLGVRVTILGRGGRVGPLSDPEVQDYATRCFQEELDLDPDAAISLVEKDPDCVTIHFKGTNGKSRKESFESVLVATGRVPKLKGLMLDQTGVELDRFGVPLFDPYTLQCGDSSLFIAGDANNNRPLLHEAADEGKIAGEGAALYPNNLGGQRRTPIGVMFSQPQVAMIGKSFSELREGEYEIGTVNFEDQGRSRVMLKNKGILRVYGEKGTGIFLGAEMIGPAAEHIAHLLAWARQQKMTVPRMLEMPFYHPVIEEGVRTALRDLNSKLHLGPKPISRCIDCGPGA